MKERLRLVVSVTKDKQVHKIIEATIKRNKKVCAAVYEQPLKHSKVQKSVQIFGTVKLINVRNNPRLFKSKARKWNLYGVLASFLKPYSHKPSRRLSIPGYTTLPSNGSTYPPLLPISPYDILGFVRSRYLFWARKKLR